MGKGCASKVRYETEREASRRAWLDRMSVYSCPDCDGYHLTRQPHGSTGIGRLKSRLNIQRRLRDAQRAADARRRRIRGGYKRK